MGYDFGTNAQLNASGSALQFYTNSAVAAEITSAGYLRKYNLPAAQGTYHTAGQVTTAMVYPLTSLSIDQSGFGNNATSTYYFVAPITGIYYAYWGSITGNNGNFNGDFQKNSGGYGINYPTRTTLGRAAASWSTSNMSITDALTAGDQWRMNIPEGNYWHGSYHSGLVCFQIG
jgi:hypothetical protein